MSRSGSTEELFNLGSLDFRWLSTSEMKAVVGSIGKTWVAVSETKWNQTSELTDIQFEIWSASHGFVPYPDVGILCRESQFIGVLAGSEWTTQRCFLIENIAIHPRHVGAPHELRIIETFVDAAIDMSMAYGFHGWVATFPKERTEQMWRDLGFSQGDWKTVRRMGYFTERDICRVSSALRRQ